MSPNNRYVLVEQVTLDTTDEDGLELECSDGGHGAVMGNRIVLLDLMTNEETIVVDNTDTSQTAILNVQFNTNIDEAWLLETGELVYEIYERDLTVNEVGCFDPTLDSLIGAYAYDPKSETARELE